MEGVAAIIQPRTLKVDGKSYQDEQPFLNGNNKVGSLREKETHGMEISQKITSKKMQERKQQKMICGSRARREQNRKLL